jgi:uncharacterized protein (DUF427 family)
MKAALGNLIVAQSDDIAEAHGYSYFPPSSVRLEWLEKSPKSADDLKCPHGVQFYDVVIDGGRHVRAAWSYEKPQPQMRHVGGRFGFWGDVKIS